MKKVDQKMRKGKRVEQRGEQRDVVARIGPSKMYTNCDDMMDQKKLILKITL